MPSETFKRLRYEPASWTVERHTVEVYIGTAGDHQVEFMRGKRPKDILRNSIVTPSLGSAILNGKYVNALPLNRISQEFERNGLNISRQTMSNWVSSFSRYFNPLWERMKEHLLELSVVQCDETPTVVVNDGNPKSGSKSYMWVHRSSELIRDKAIILYEYQTSRDHIHPLEFYRNFQEGLETDGLQQYRLVEQKVEGLTNANCWAHARRDFADACKAMDKKNVMAYRSSAAHRALELIGKIYEADEKLKDLTPGDRIRKRRIKVAPLVEAFFAWAKEQLASGVLLPKSKTVEGLNYCISREDSTFFAKQRASPPSPGEEGGSAVQYMVRISVTPISRQKASSSARLRTSRSSWNFPPDLSTYPTVISPVQMLFRTTGSWVSGS